MGIGFDVVVENLQLADDRGRPRTDDRGLPLFQAHTTIVLIRNHPDGQHILKIPLNDEAKKELIKKLTGGVIVPPNSSVQL